jgi:hypothetical protein
MPRIPLDLNLSMFKLVKNVLVCSVASLKKNRIPAISAYPMAIMLNTEDNIGTSLSNYSQTLRNLGL